MDRENERIKELLLRCYKGIMGIEDEQKDPLAFTMLVGELFIRLCNHFNIDPFVDPERNEGAKQEKTES